MNKEMVLNEKILEVALADPNSYFVFMDGTAFVHASKLRGKIAEERIINAGIGEQNAAGFAAGLSKTGKKVYLICCPFFLVTRAYEQIRDDIAYNNANVTIWATKSGIVSYPQGGYGHWGIEDISLMRNLPNMIVANCATENELVYYWNYSKAHQGPMYLMDENCWCRENPDFKIEFGKLSVVKKGKDFIIITTGHALEKGLMLRARFRAAGYKPMLVDCHCLKPFDEKGIQKLIQKGKPIISIDEHTQGGLTDLISQVIAKSGKKVTYLPFFVHTDKCNLVGGYEYLANQMMGYEKMDQQILRCLKKWYHYLICPKITFLGDGRAKVKYKLFGVFPVLKTVSRKKKGHHLSSRKYYLFGFLRIF